MTLTQLEYFVRVAETGHLTQTAKEFLIAQPSLTQSIHKLESECGFPLFEKSGRRILLTREGHEFLLYARQVVEAHAAAQSAAHRIRQENRGLIRFSHTEPTPGDFIPNLIYQFLEKPENARVRIESGVAGTAQIYQQLRDDEIDFGFCSDGMDPGSDLVLYPLFRRPMVLITSKDDPLCQQTPVEPEDLVHRPCVAYVSDSVMSRQITRFWEGLGLQPDVRYRSSAVAIGGLVARGLGWAFAVLTDEIENNPNLTVLPMPKLSIERTTCLAMRSSRKHSPSAERFFRFVLSFSEQFQ